MTLRTDVLVSGSGTNLKSMLDLKLPIGQVIADKQCQGIIIAHEAGIPTVIVNRKAFGYKPGIDVIWDREGFTRALVAVLAARQTELVVMAGFMTVLHEIFFTLFQGDIINLHPSLLPSFPGEHAIEDAYKAGVGLTGSTAHIATEVLDDASYIIRQVEVPRYPDDTIEDLKARIKARENEYYPEVVQGILAGTINLEEIRSKS